MGGRGLVASCLSLGQMAGFSVYGDELAGYLKCGEFLN
jgi:hypothetical protein